MTGSEPPPLVDAAAFRALISRWATGVSVVTAHDGTVDAGLTVNALLSIALSPPVVLVSLNREVDTLPVLERSRAFAVNLLAADQRALSETFARPTGPAEKFRGLAFHRRTTGAALLEGTLGSVECRVAAVLPSYDHRLVIGEVVATETGRDAAPLLFYRSAYAEADRNGRVVLGEATPRRGEPPRQPR